ncbi:unnamed protein product, partial [marine sediment metagenome]
YRVAYSFVATIVIGFLALFLIGKNPFSLIANIWGVLLHPFYLKRIGLTVAENAQPYLNDWVAQIGKLFFWLFYAGSVLIGVELTKGMKNIRSKL